MRKGVIKALSLSAILLGCEGCMTIDFHPKNDKYIPATEAPDSTDAKNLFQGIGYAFEDMTDEITGQGYEDRNNIVGPYDPVRTKKPIDHRILFIKYRYPWQEDAFKVIGSKKDSDER